MLNRFTESGLEKSKLDNSSKFDSWTMKIPAKHPLKSIFRQIIAEFVPEWKEIGFKWFGGCCRTTPEDIQNIRSAVFTK